MERMSNKPHLTKYEIWNMSIGFLGIQMGFALQNGNASRILQTFGADIHELSWFWLVAPITGMIVQPIIGHMSDRTWTRLGRRKPFFLTGAILASLGLLLMPNAAVFASFLPALWIGAGMLMIMDASFNIAMEPFRALVADKLATEQRTEGYSAQTTLIGIGAVIGSWLPYALTNWIGIKSNNDNNDVPLSLIISFIIGAIVLLLSILWTIKTTREYNPDEMASFDSVETHHKPSPQEKNSGFLADIINNLVNMPATMKQLGWVQFFSWFALFGMWVYTTPAIANHIYGLSIEDHSSQEYNDAGDWVGIIFGVYNLVSAIYAFYGLPHLAKKYGRKKAHIISLICGGLGLISIFFAPNKEFLILSMMGVGLAWASILAMPYAILAGSIPPKKMGVYMGIFNLFITIPQIISGIVGGPLVKFVYHDKAIYALVVSGLCMLIAALATTFVKDVDEISK
jgi:maltose/moltooligosaccharide transporter